ncbi:MAG: hypothetical protein AAF824_07115 [Bacteroidota bacterium]
MKVIVPFSIKRREKEENAYLEHKIWNRYIFAIGRGVERIARDHAFTIAKACKEASSEISQVLDKGFQEVKEQQVQIHHALIDQTQVIHDGFQTLDITLEQGFQRTAEELQEVTHAVDAVNTTLIATQKRLEDGFSGLQASLDAGMVSLVSQFELQREELREGMAQLTSILQNSQKTIAQERYLDGKKAFELYLKHPDEPQLLEDAKNYFLESINFYRGNPFSHWYLGHIYQEPTGMYDEEASFTHYRACATYAKSIENPQLAALGFFMAGWMSYVMGKVPEAITLTQECIQQAETPIPEAMYHLAKFYAYQLEAESSLGHLQKLAEQWDPRYILKSQLDEDFNGIRSAWEGMVNEMRDREAAHFQQQWSLLAADEVQQKLTAAEE